jgi:LCP family protein required for cell wall assembly
MPFQKKQLRTDNELQGKEIVESIMSRKFAIIAIIVALFAFFGGYARQYFMSVGSKATQAVMRSVWSKVSTAIEDERGNINVVLAWYAGKNAMWWLLTDSMMLVSYNPKLNAATFISVPRDLYVSFGTWLGAGKLNGLLWNVYLNSTGSEEQKIHMGAKQLMKKMWDITGIEPQYYGLINFDGFVHMIDSVWGVNVDVPQRLYDTQFPDDNYKWYITLDIPAGQQMMDGKTALRYARSRHSTSDFSRAERQQLIISALVDTMVGQLNISNISNFKEVFSQLSQVVQTNVDISDLIGFLPWLAWKRSSFHFVLSADCDNIYVESTQPGCVLYNADKSLFGGAATILPKGAAPNKLSYYRYTQEFGARVTEHQWMLKEKAALTIVNNIDKEYAKQQTVTYNGLAGKLAISLKEKAFLIDDVQWTVETATGTTLYVINPEEYKETIRLLQTIVPIDTIMTGSSPLYIDMTLSLGNSYIDMLKKKEPKKNP